MNTGAKPTLSGGKLQLPNELLFSNPCPALTLPFTPLPKKMWCRNSTYLLSVPSHKLHYNWLIWLGINYTFWIWTSLSDSWPTITELPEFLTSCTASGLALHGSTERQEAPVHCCRCEAGCWAAWRILQLLPHCAQHRACSVPITAMSRSHHAALSHGGTHTNTHNNPKIPGSIPLQQHQGITAIPISQNKT